MRTFLWVKSSSIILLAGALSACFNAVSFHQSERVSIALEARTTDPQQPVQGTIGIRNRTIVVAPGKRNIIATGFQQPGEATSIISDLNFVRSKGDSNGFGKTTVTSAFIAGAAANSAPTDAIKAISGLGANPLGDLTVMQEQTLRNILAQLEQMNRDGDAVATGHLAALNALADKLPTDLATRVYYNFSAGNITSNPLGTLRSGFAGVLDYDVTMRQSLAGIREIEGNRAYTQNGNAITPDQMTALLQAKNRIAKERQELYKTIGSNSAIDVAAAYVIGKL